MAIKCCRYCVPPKRHQACWDTCTDYIKEKAEDEKNKERDRRRREIDGGIIQQRERHCRRALKKRNRS